MRKTFLVLIHFLLLTASLAQAQFTYTTNADNTVTLTSYTGSGGAVTIPTNINGFTVTGIGASAFESSLVLDSVTIPSSVTSIGDYAFYGCPALTNVTIPGSITNIGIQVFMDCGLISVTIGSGVTNIGDHEFANCGALTKVTFPDGVINIGNYAFEGCGNLTIVIIPSSVTSIGYSTFNSCPSLASLFFTGNAPSVGLNVFAGDKNATVFYSPGTAGWNPAFGNAPVELGGLPAVLWNPSNLSQFDYFTNAGTVTITSYTGPGGAVTIPFTLNGLPVTSIGQDAFFYCTNLTSIMIPATVTSIGDAAFAECQSLVSVAIPGSLISIGDYAFLGCGKLTTLTIPSSVTTIGDGVFSACTSLTAIYFTGNAPSVGPNAISGDTLAMVFYSLGTFGWDSTLSGFPANAWNSSSISQFDYTATAGTITITRYTGPGGAVTVPFAINGLPVTAIGQDAFFFNNSSLVTRVTIPGSISTIADEAFYGCASLTNVTIPSGVTSIGQQAFSLTPLTGVTIPGSLTNMGPFAFAACASLQTAIITDGVTHIGDWAFLDCASLTTVSLPSSLAEIGNSVFSGCSSLASITIPDSVNSLGGAVFTGCSSLANVTVPSSVTTIGASAFDNCSSLTAIMVDAQNRFYRSVNGVLFDKNEVTLIQYPGGLGGSYAIPDGVASILNGAFDGNRLLSVTIPSSVTNIGDAAFNFCLGLTAITVDTQNAFYSGLNGVLFNKDQTSLIQYPIHLSGAYAIPSSVTQIENNAFASCSNLTSVQIPGNVTNIGASAFANCGLTSVMIANGVISIGASAFNGCGGLTNVTIPASVTGIGLNAFSYCTNLTSVFFSGDAPNAGLLAGFIFTFDNNATGYYLPGTTGWNSTFGGLSMVLWNPLIQTKDGIFGMQSNQFRFNITGTTNIPILIEACTNLANPVWTPLQTVSLTNGSFDFSESVQTNSLGRYYRISSP